MDQGRRKFIERVALASGMVALSPQLSGAPFGEGLSNGSASGPWIDLSREAYLHNAKTISTLAKGSPVLAVLKNNGYGLGDVEVAKILDQAPEISGIAQVKDDRTLALKRGGVKKPVLLMADFNDELGPELVKHGVVLSIFSEASLNKIISLSKKKRKTVNVALYVDTGLGRMGIPYDQALEIGKKAGAAKGLNIQYTFSTLTSPKDFATEQIARFDALVNQLKSAGVDAGQEHLAPSMSMLDLPDSHKDMVRPGILLHGSYPVAHMDLAKEVPLKTTFRLKASVMRLEKLSAGDTIGFSRFYEVTKDEWIATLPVGWADGYYSGAENGAKVLLGDKLYPVVNVNASHTNVSLGTSTNVQVGDVATLIGPDRPEITPEGFGKLTKGHNYLQINYKESIPKTVYDRF